MKILKLVNRKKESLARVTWESPDKISVEMLEASDEDFKSKLTTFIDECCRDGVLLLTGKQIEQEGQTILFDEKIKITSSDERFLSALSDAISSHHFGEQKERVFGLLEQKAE